MARPLKSERPEPIDTLILDASTRLFAERGFDGVTLAAIASEVGIRPQSIAHHFGSKEQLYVAVVERFYERLMTSFGSSITIGDVRASVPALLTSLRHLPDLERDLLVTIVTELLNAGRAAAVIESAVTPLLDRIEADLTRDCDGDAPVRETLALLMFGAVLTLDSDRISPGLASLRRSVWGRTDRFDTLVERVLASVRGPAPRT